MKLDLCQEFLNLCEEETKLEKTVPGVEFNVSPETKDFRDRYFLFKREKLKGLAEEIIAYVKVINAEIYKALGTHVPGVSNLFKTLAGKNADCEEIQEMKKIMEGTKFRLMTVVLAEFSRRFRYYKEYGKAREAGLDFLVISYFFCGGSPEFERTSVAGNLLMALGCNYSYCDSRNDWAKMLIPLYPFAICDPGFAKWISEHDRLKLPKDIRQKMIASLPEYEEGDEKAYYFLKVRAAYGSIWGLAINACRRFYQEM